MLTIERLKEVLEYDPATGVWRWRVKGRGRRRIVGCIDDKRYRKIMTDGVNYKSSRLAVFYMTGGWPVEFVDHRKRDRDNDRWENLRPATHMQNQWNMQRRKPPVSGCRGVYPFRSKWCAKIMVAGKRIHLDVFTDRNRACAVRRAAEVQYYGEFA